MPNSASHNVIVLMCDQLRYDALSYHGNRWSRTPNLDRLAARSVRLRNAFAQSPLCGPARHTLLTGRYPYQHGVINNKALPYEGMRTVAHLLGERNFRTACFGHMHWQQLPDGSYPEHGFDLFGAAHHCTPPQKRGRLLWESLHDTQFTSAGVSILDSDEMYGRQVADAAIARLREDAAQDRPFLNWISFNEPHPPFFAPPEYYALFDPSRMPLPVGRPDDPADLHPGIYRHPVWARLADWDHQRIKAAYYALVHFADHCVGRVLDAIDQLDLWHNSTVLFTVDHGEQMGDHGLYLKSVFREPCVHVPLMICHPGVPPGDRDHLVEHTDVLPTLCDLAGASAPAEAMGKSLMPMLRDCDAPEVRSYALCQLNCNAMVRSKRWKLVYYDGEPGEFFDLQSDPLEMCNLLHSPHAVAWRDCDEWLGRHHPDLFGITRQAQQSMRVRRFKPKPRVIMPEQ